MVKKKKRNNINNKKNVNLYRKRANKTKKSAQSLNDKMRDINNLKENNNNKIKRDLNTNILIPEEKILFEDSNISDKSTPTFTTFTSFDGIPCIIYGDKKKSIIIYNLISFQKITEIKHAHGKAISKLIHYPDISNKRDLLLSISSENKNVKLWNISTLECILNIQKDKKDKSITPLFSACLINDNNEIYVVTAGGRRFSSDPVYIYDCEGKNFGEVKAPGIKINCESYYDNKLNKNYIILSTSYVKNIGINRTCFVGFGIIRSYEFNKKELYKEYKVYDNNKQGGSNDLIIVKDNNEKINLISINNNNIDIWDFHSGNLLRTIEILSTSNDINYSINCFCLWNNKYLFVGYKREFTDSQEEVNEIKIIDLDINKSIKNIRCNNNIKIMEKIIHPQYGECVIFQESKSYYKNQGLKYDIKIILKTNIL